MSRDFRRLRRQPRPAPADEPPAFATLVDRYGRMLLVPVDPDVEWDLPAHHDRRRAAEAAAVVAGRCGTVH